MTVEMMTLTPQLSTAHWGWTIAWFLWFVGLSGMGLVVNYWIGSKKVMWLSTVAVWVGTLLVMSHLSRLTNLPVALFESLRQWSFNFGSWMLVGIVILGVLCVWTLAQSVAICDKAKHPALRWLRDWKPRHAINVALGLIATIYSGFLLTQAVGVTLWHTASLPLLWVASGLGCALGVVELMKARGFINADLPWLKTVPHAVHAAEVVILVAMLSVAATGSPGQVAGFTALTTGHLALMFWGGAVGLGIVIPSVTMVTHSKAAMMIAGIAAMLGALFLRASILMAGYFDPVWMP